MIDLYSWPTPNGHKVHIMLEETGLEYTVHGVDINRGEQFEPEFLAISPNNKIPAMIDHDGPKGRDYAVFESGAMLLYLAEKTGQFLPEDPEKRFDVIQWLMFQMGGVGPMFGQAHHFRQYAPEKIEYAIQRYTREAGRLYGVMDRVLGEREYLALNEYTIADIATFPWVRPNKRQGQDLDDFPNVKRWFDAIRARPAVERALQVLADRRREDWSKDDAARNFMFGDAQYQRR